MAKPTGLLTRPTDERTIAVLGDVYRFLTLGEDTAGQYSLFEAVIQPGGGPPPHVHSREAEGFYILDGEMTFYLDGRRHTAGPGGYAHLPIGLPHYFRNETDSPVRMLISVFPAGFEKFLFEIGEKVPVDTLTGRPPTPEDVSRLLEAAPRYGLKILAP
ncbi:MAG: cupin domain-containing protein [Gemmataceae bacterium]|nr:cupin domain-containing protein [Gemmataceae bacterium]